MINESRPRMRSRTGPVRSLRRSQAFLALVSAVGLVLGVLVLATPGQADDSDGSNVPSEAQATENRTPDGDEKVTICHFTGSEKNSYVEIRVDSEGLNGHGDHPNDIIPMPEEGCPSDPPGPATGSLELKKKLEGGPKEYTGPFTIAYECSMDDAMDITGSRDIESGSSATVMDIPDGYECEISEPSLPVPPDGFSFGVPTFEPSATVQIKSKDKVTVTTQNTLSRDEGNLRITKSLTGTPADYDPDFDVSYTCTMEGEDDITGSATVAAGGSVELPNEGTIPTGYECTVVEGALPTLPAGYSWNAPGYSNNQGTDPGNVVTIVKNTVLPPDQELPIDQMATVAIANSATTPSVPVTPASGAGAGALTVSKTLTGGPEGFAPAFSIAWTCSGSTGSLSGVLSIAAGGSATVFNVPNGFTCSVSEDTLPDAPTGFSWGTPAVSGSPTSAIAGNSTVSVTVANSLIAEEVAPVEPASPVQPTVPVEPASPVGPAQVEPAGVPLIVPAGGGGSFGTNDGVPVWGYLAAILSLGLAIWGAAYLLRGL